MMNSPCNFVDPLGLAAQCTLQVHTESPLPKAALAEINRILDGAKIQANFPPGDGSVTLKQDASQRETGGFPGAFEGTTAYVDNFEIEFTAGLRVQKKVQLDANGNLALGRVIAHELAHILTGIDSDDTQATQDSILTSHTRTELFGPDPGSSFDWLKKQAEAALKTCQTLAQQGGGGGAVQHDFYLLDLLGNYIEKLMRER